MGLEFLSLGLYVLVLAKECPLRVGFCVGLEFMSQCLDFASRPLIFWPWDFPHPSSNFAALGIGLRSEMHQKAFPHAPSDPYRAPAMS